MKSGDISQLEKDVATLKDKVASAGALIGKMKEVEKQLQNEIE